MRATLLVLTLCLLGSAAPGCNKKSREAGPVSSMDKAKGAGKGIEFGVDKGSVHPKIESIISADKPMSSPALAEAVVGREKSRVKNPAPQGPPAGILTAGSFDDNLDPLVFNSFTAKMSQNRELGDLPAKLQGQRLLVIVKNAAGKPVGNARIKLTANLSAVGTGFQPAHADKLDTVETTTRSDGRAVFVLSWDRLPADQPLLATVTPPDGRPPVHESIPAGSPRWEITLPGASAPLPKNLDLAIVLDTTGSMGDELVYLKAEIRGIAETIRKKFPEVQQRYALVLYRDEGDEYVVRRFDFTGSLSDFHKNLSVQTANGGGDYPEAVHKGLEEANQLRWRESDTARVLFLVGDAPPHAQHMGRTLAAANGLRKKGVAIYPVACSGYDQACEFIWRSCALLTGSRFLFLTDDSEVGNSHAEPTIPYYQVERLERLMIRMIAGELSGQQVLAQPGDILRTVGKKVN